MDILWALLTLPYAPVRGLTALVKVVAREAESQQYNPVNVRRELEELDEAAAAGDITPEERDRGQQQVLDRLTKPAAGAGRTGARRDGAPGRPAPARRGNGGGRARRGRGGGP
ncbi:gas vesicle protein GvpG [Micromonospora chersina]|uniref:Gas vesicle protein G n=1 Tax=Micromonospora chersina TaxID=47854 RepID=A0A1C6VN69_9ACTN|nr:gas vesicle protein GvpG [Micromonospora chersina]SCL67350.1 Gas vesicle protein G [Micromonospora chersina]